MRGKLYDIITIFVRENFNELAKALDRADAANTEGTTSLEECLMREVLAATGAKAQRRKGADDLIGSARLVACSRWEALIQACGLLFVADCYGAMQVVVPTGHDGRVRLGPTMPFSVSSRILRKIGAKPLQRVKGSAWRRYDDLYDYSECLADAPEWLMERIDEVGRDIGWEML